MKLLNKMLLLGGVMLFLNLHAGHGQKKTDPYSLDWETLSRHPIPDWYRDAKFGIYAHLGVYCVPAHESEWYPRYMYSEGHPVQDYHRENYGPVEEFGYQDFIPLFKLENFDANEWAKLYKRAGARFAGPVAEHHDGFSMWNSKVNRWNAKDMGPKRDVVGELAKAIRKQDMRLITSFHHAFNLGGYYPSMPGTATTDPEFADLYGKFEDPETGFERWLKKIEEVIDAYEPDQIWFDWGLRSIPMEYRRKMASYYYSKEKDWGKEVIITRKLDQLPDGVGVLDLEGGGNRNVTPYLWQTDQSTGGHIWSWREGIHIRSTHNVLYELIDVVSKNGIMLLNVCPAADGSIPGGQKEMLYEIGDWLKLNGEAIYGTRPWRVHGEGPQLYGKYGYYMRWCSADQQNPVNLRYTSKGDTVYAICLEWPGEGFTFDKVRVNEGSQGSIQLLGHGEVASEVRDGRLHIPELAVDLEDMPCDHAWVFKLEGFDLEADPFSKLETLYLNADNATPTGRIIVRPANHWNSTEEERNRLYHWDNPRDKVYWLANVKLPGEYLVRGELATRFNQARLVLDNGEDELHMVTEPRQVYGEGVLKDYGSIHFSKTGLYRIELRLEDLDDFPGIQGFWQLELAPVE